MLLTSELQLAKKVLDESGVIAFPTETVMGLGIYFNDEKAYKRLNEIKNRPEDKPYTLMLADKTEISKYAYIDNKAQKVINTFMPGPITILLKSKDIVPGYVTHNTGIIGIRVPDTPLVIELINYCKTPLLVPSANKSGNKPALTSYEVKDIFHDEVGYVFNADSGRQAPSTIIDLTGEEVKILREGPITLDDINKIINGGK